MFGITLSVPFLKADFTGKIKGNIIWLTKCLYDLKENAVEVTHMKCHGIFFLASYHFSIPKNSGCHFLTDIEVDSRSELSIHSFAQAFSCKLILSQVQRQTYSFNSRLIYMESQIIVSLPKENSFSPSLTCNHALTLLLPGTWSWQNKQ